MKHQARRAQGEVIDFIEQRLGWEVVEAVVNENEGYRDDPDVLELHVSATFELDEESDYRHDTDTTEGRP